MKTIKATLIGTAALGLVLSGCAQEPARDASGAIVEAQDRADVFAIKVGDCVKASGEGEMDTVPVVPCKDAHEAEVYAAKTLPTGEFPSRAALDKAIEELCVTEFEKFVGVSFDESKLDFYNLEPTRESWTMGDRELQCLVIDPEGPTTGSLKNAKR